LIATSEKYLYGSDTNILWLVYNVSWITDKDQLNWKKYNYSYYNYIPVNLWFDWKFDSFLRKTVTYRFNWNIENSQSSGGIKELTYNYKTTKPFLYSIYTNYEPDNWAKNFYYVNFSKNEGENNSSTTYSTNYKDKVYVVENEPNIKENNNWLNSGYLDTTLLTDYFKTNYDFDTLYVKKDIVWGDYYLFWIKWSDKQVFKLNSLGNGVYNLNWCVVDNESYSNTLSNNTNLRLTVNWHNSIAYNEGDFDTSCLATNFIDRINFNTISLSGNNKTSHKIVDENNFYIKKGNSNLYNYLDNDVYYTSKDIVLKLTNTTLSNILLQINKKLDKKPFIVYVDRDNNNIKQITYNPEIQLSDYKPDGDSSYDYTKDNYDKNHYRISTTIENKNTSNILQLKIKKDSNITYLLTYNGFIKNAQTFNNDWNDLISLSYDKKDTNNYGSVTIDFYKDWNLDKSYTISFEKKPFINNITAIGKWNSWFLNSDWKRYSNLTTTDKSNIFTLWLSTFNLFCKKLNYKLTFTSPNITNNLYIYNNKVIGNNEKAKESTLKSWMRVVNSDVLSYSNEIDNINLKNYTDNVLKFYIESNNITNDTSLNVNTNIQCDWKNIENKNYTLNIKKDNYDNLSVVFYNPIMKQNDNTLIYNSSNQKIKYKNVENRLKINYYSPWIQVAEFDKPVNWLDDTWWNPDGNSNKTYNDLFFKSVYWEKYAKIDNRYQYSNNNTTQTKGIVYSSFMKSTQIEHYNTQPHSPPVCSYTTCSKSWCTTHQRIWEDKTLYYHERNYSWINYPDLLWWSLQTEHSSLNNSIKSNKIWKVYAYNKIVNFTVNVNVPSRVVKIKNANFTSSYYNLITPFFYIRNMTNEGNLQIEYKDSDKLFWRIKSNTYGDYKNNYLQKGILYLNKKLQWYVKYAWLRKTIVWPCLTDYNNWTYNNTANQKKCYVTYDTTHGTLAFTDNRYYNYNKNTYQNKDVFPISNWKNILQIQTLKGIVNLNYIVDVFVVMKAVPRIGGGDNYNLDYIDNSPANALLDNGGENLLSLDLPVQYVWQFTMLWKLLGWTKLDWQKINDFLSFYNTVSSWDYNKILYWINIFKEYFTKIMDGHQDSAVRSKRYYSWYHCSRTNYSNTIVSKNFITDHIKKIKLNFWAWYYPGWYNNSKYPSYFNDFNYNNDYNNIKQMIDKNVDYWITNYNLQVWQLGWKIKLFWFWYTNNPWKFYNNKKLNVISWKMTDISSNPNFIANAYENWNSKYKKNDIVDYIKNGKYYNKIITITDNNDLNLLLFNWSDNNWNTLSPWKWITKIIVNLPNVYIGNLNNGNNNLAWNVSLIVNWKVHITSNINKTQENYYMVIENNDNTTVANNVDYIGGVYLITKNILTNFSSNPLFIYWFVYNMGNSKFICNRNITSLFLLNSSKNYYSDYNNITTNNVALLNFNNYWQKYTSYKTVGCIIKNNTKMRDNFLFNKTADVWF